MDPLKIGSPLTIKRYSFCDDLWFNLKLWYNKCRWTDVANYFSGSAKVVKLKEVSRADEVSCHFLRGTRHKPRHHTTFFCHFQNFAKDDLRNAYEKCNDISQESRALIVTFLKEESDKDYELNLSMYGKAAKLEKQMDANLDIDDSDLHLTHVLRSSSSARVEPSPYTPNPVTIIPGPAGIVQLSSSTSVDPSSSTPNSVRIIPGPAGVVQQVKLLKENVFILNSDGALMSTQEYM
nr:hypothetical protein [Tanacetum cinerariifolium]